MDKYRNFVVIEELKTLLRQGKNEEALELAEGMNPKKIKDNCDCMVLAEVFLNNGMLGKAKECYNVIYDRKKNRRVAMELVNISIRLKKADDAEMYFEDYRKMAPNDYFNYIFKYKIDRLKGKSLKEQAESLEQLKKIEFFDNWGYELAKLYHKMGETEKCTKVCDDIITWFGDGEWVDKAKAMIAYYSGEITLKELTAPRKAETEKETKSESAVIPEKNETAENVELSDESDISKESDVSEGPVSLETPENDQNDPESINNEIPDTDNIEYSNIAAEDTGDMAMVEENIPDEDADMKIVGQVNESKSEEVNNSEEDYTEEEYTEEDLAIVEEDTIKVLTDDDRLIKEIKTEVRDADLSTDELAKQIEAVLKEDSEKKAEQEKEVDPDDMTKEWKKGAINTAYRRAFEKAVDEKVEEMSAEEQKEKEREREKEKEKALTKEEDKAEEESSPLLEAVGRELGFVGEEKDQSGAPKKGWFSRLREKHLEKERKKQEELIKSVEKEAEENIKKEKENDLEKQKFIENEKRKDRQRYLNNQMRMAKLANDKAKSMNEPDRQEILETAKTEGKIYTPKKMKCIEVPVNSPVEEILNDKGRTLEDYFGFFACQKDMASQILKCLERLLDNNEDYMNYCIIGDKGNGRKAIAHGFARFMADAGKISTSQTVWTDAGKVNEIDLSAKTDKLSGRCLVISSAGSLKADSVDDISKVIEKLGRKVMVVLTDYRHDMVELFRNREAFESLFRPRVSVPVFNQDDLFDYVDYKVDKAGFVFDVEAYDLMAKRIKSIMRATEEGALARTERYVVKTMDNAEQRNGEAYIKQTLEHERHVRSNVIISSDLPTTI